jgi:hypothetical protein
MAKLCWIIFLISFLCIFTDAKSNNHFDHLPQSIIELKQYYDVVNNLEKRGILNADIADQEKRLYIEYASKLDGSTKLLTEEEFLTWKQRQLIVSFSNIIAVIAGVIVVIALTILIGIFVVPLLVQIPAIFWESLFYFLAFYLMILTSNSWLIFLGCLAFVATLTFTIQFHYSRERKVGLVAAWICCIVWSIVAIYQQNREAGYLAVMAFEASLGFVVFVGELVIMIGFQNETVIPSATIASFILILIGSILHLQQQSNFLTLPFTRPLLFLGTFVYFIGMTIITSRLYTRWPGRELMFWLLQLITFCSGLAAMFFGPMLQIPYIEAIGGTMFVFWLLEKYVEIAPWKNVFTVVVSLFGFGVLLYGFAYFLKTNPEYFIFHNYSLK